jgi:hypothetical protein
MAVVSDLHIPKTWEDMCSSAPSPGRSPFPNGRKKAVRGVAVRPQAQIGSTAQGFGPLDLQLGQQRCGFQQGEVRVCRRKSLGHRLVFLRQQASAIGLRVDDVNGRSRCKQVGLPRNRTSIGVASGQHHPHEESQQPIAQSRRSFCYLIHST